MEVQLVNIMGKPRVINTLGEYEGEWLNNSVIIFKVIDIEKEYSFEILFTIIKDEYKIILHDEDKANYNEDDILKLLIDKYTEKTLKEI